MTTEPPQSFEQTASAEGVVRSARIVERLKATQLYREYEAAFRRATGLPLMLRSAGGCEEESTVWMKDGNPFCEVMAAAPEGCASCRQVRAHLEEGAQVEPQTLQCFAGLCGTAVPVRVSGGRVALLHTGQVLLHEPNAAEFHQTEQQLRAWHAGVDFTTLKKAYFQTRVLDPVQYEAMVRLLATFADHLALACSDLLEEEEASHEPRLVRAAKEYISEHFQERISLDDAAGAVHASTRHFCKVFKATTGRTFTDYLARVRVEKAQQSLRDPYRRVSEIAFETGFESISQFNRSFKRITGLSPTCFRAASEINSDIERQERVGAGA
ncbi:MAG: helix-turn-helix domain-containing protein [Opitutales bacterium]